MSGLYLIIFTNFVPIPEEETKKSISKITFNILVFPADIIASKGHKLLIFTCDK